jgi:hypothetical protein
MSHYAKRLAVTVGAAAALVGGAAPAALAAPPTFERIPINDVFADEFLTEECGVAVTTTAVGHITIRTFDRAGTGPVELATINITLTSRAGDNSYRVKNVGADLLRREPDGTLVLSIVGQVPFGFTGVLKLDPDTGEVIQQPQHSTAGDLAKACAALTA